jgi:hypothetical protein
MKNNKLTKLQKAQYNVRALRLQALQHDGIEDSAFVVFSKDNPFIPAYNKAVTELLVARQNENLRRNSIAVWA